MISGAGRTGREILDVFPEFSGEILVTAKEDVSSVAEALGGDCTGALILMDEAGKTWFEAMRPGSLHYIPGFVAHRLANTGDVPLRVGACWPSDAGHDYASIASAGFTARLMCVHGVPTLVDAR